MKSKKLPCKQCGFEVAVRSKGLCPACRRSQRKEAGELPVYQHTPKRRSTLKTSKKGFKTKSEKIQTPELKAFFDFHIERLTENPVSEGSGRFILSPSKLNIAHIFPKAYYQSVATHKDNCIYLTWQEHTDFDNMTNANQWDRLKQKYPKIYELACTRAKKLLPLVQEQHKWRFNLEDHLTNTQ